MTKRRHRRGLCLGSTRHRRREMGAIGSNTTVTSKVMRPRNSVPYSKIAQALRGHGADNNRKGLSGSTQMSRRWARAGSYAGPFPRVQTGMNDDAKITVFRPRSR